MTTTPSPKARVDSTPFDARSMTAGIPPAVPGALRRLASVRPVSPAVGRLRCARGSVLDYGGGGTDDGDAASARARAAAAAIVNAANEGCLGGGGVDGAVNQAGGPRLRRDRLALPVLSGATDPPGAPPVVRCRTGGAVATGPNHYGSLRVPWVIHAVGPDYGNFPPDAAGEGHALLARAYAQSLDRAAERGIRCLGVALLSAGAYRAQVPLVEILVVALRAIRAWRPPPHVGESSSHQPPILEVTLCAFTEDECTALLQACDEVFSNNSDATEDS